MTCKGCEILAKDNRKTWKELNKNRKGTGKLLGKLENIRESHFPEIAGPLQAQIAQLQAKLDQKEAELKETRFNVERVTLANEELLKVLETRNLDITARTLENEALRQEITDLRTDLKAEVIKLTANYVIEELGTPMEQSVVPETADVVPEGQPDDPKSTDEPEILENK